MASLLKLFAEGQSNSTKSSSLLTSCQLHRSSTAPNMGISLEQNPASHGFTSTYFNFSFSLSLFASFHTPKSRGDQDGRKADPPPARTFDTYLDEISQDTSQLALSPEIQEMQNAARTAYLKRLARISDRASLQCLEKATKERLEWAAHLDRESLEKLEFATKMLKKLKMKTPPKKTTWQYNAHTSPVETEASSSSESKRVHSIQDSPCQQVLMRKEKSSSAGTELQARTSSDLQLRPQHENNTKDDLFNEWVKRDIARVVAESESTSKVENPFGAFGKDLDTMIAESEVLKSMSPVKVQETEEAGTFFESPFKSFYSSKQEDENKEEEEGLGSVELNPDFAEYDQEEQVGSKDEDEEEEWTDLGGSKCLEDS